MKRGFASLSNGTVAAGIFALLVLASSAFAQARATGPHTTVTLLANRASVASSGQILIGLHFQMEKGWHIYWENPGDSGEPPKIQWQAPTGFRIGAIEWPAPEKLMAPSIVDYGYENDVLLFAPLNAPAAVRNRKSVTIAANVNWLVCREMCIPGKAQLSLTLPVAGRGAANATTEAIFRKAHSELPAHVPDDWKVYATNEKDDFMLTIETGRQESGATFFPLEAEQVNNAAVQAATPFARGVRLKLQKSDGLLKPIARLRGVLELGPGRTYEVTAPVYAAAKGNS